MVDKPSEAEIFDRALRRRRRDRAAAHGGGFLHTHIADELIERLLLVKRDFVHALDLGCGAGGLGRMLAARGIRVISADAGLAFARGARGVQCDEDRLPFADASFDLIVSAGGLESVNDLPGALALARRALRPDGLFLAGLIGAGSLPRLRAALLAGDLAAGDPSPRIHPQIDVRSAGDLLARAGFALPVADGERLDVRYASLGVLLADLRAGGCGNLLHAREPTPSPRLALAAAHADFLARADADGRVTERIEIVHLLGWAPAPDQPQPARRGSAAASLADALKARA